jgi:hypothetical protein
MIECIVFKPHEILMENQTESEIFKDFTEANDEYEKNTNYNFKEGVFNFKDNFSIQEWEEEDLNNRFSFCKNYLLKPNSEYATKANSARTDKFITRELKVYQIQPDKKRIKNAIGIAQYCYGELMKEASDEIIEIISEKTKKLAEFVKTKHLA